MENGLPGGAVSPTDTSAVNTIRDPSTVRVSHFLRGTTQEKANPVPDLHLRNTAFG